VSVRRGLVIAILAGLGSILAVRRDIHAQPMAGGGMPNLRAIAGKPLPDRGMPAGMVTVRVARKVPSVPVPGVEITALIEGPGGDMRKRTAKTDAEGRGSFEGVPAGHRFQAEVVVDQEKLTTDTFPMPDAGGVRTMLISGLPAQGPGDDGASEGADGAGDKPFSLGLVAGSVRLDPSLPTGTVEVLALDEAGRPLANKTIELGKVTTGQSVQVTQQVTGADGRARFSDLTSGQAAGGAGGPAAAVVMEQGGLRLGSDGFQLPQSGGGVAVELRAPQKSADPALITVGAGGRIVLQLREDGLAFIETLPLENRTDKLFDPGAGGLEIPLPKEAVGTEAAEGVHKTDIRKGVGLAVRGPIPPRRPEAQNPNQKSPDEVTLGFLLPAHGSVREFEQRFPNGMGEYTFVTDQVDGLVIESAQITGKQAREVQGKKYWLMHGEPIAPGGVLQFTVRGLPAPDNTGRIISGVLALSLVGGAIAFGRKPPGAAASKDQSERERLVQRREKLFAELVTVEGRRSGDGAAGVPSSAATKLERDDLVRKLEGVYRELAAVDERRAV